MTDVRDLDLMKVYDAVPPPDSNCMRCNYNEEVQAKWTLIHHRHDGRWLHASCIEAVCSSDDDDGLHPRYLVDFLREWNIDVTLGVARALLCDVVGSEDNVDDDDVIAKAYASIEAIETALAQLRIDLARR